MRKLIGLLIIPLLLATPVLAASLGISPSYTELQVPGNGSATANFKVHYFSGDLQISLVDIPLKVKPEAMHIEPSGEPVDIQITIYGDEALGSQAYDGYVRFLGMTGGTVSVAVKVKAKVINVVEGQVVAVSTGPPEEVFAESKPSTTLGLLGFEWYIYAIIGLAVAIVVIVAIAVVRARRRY